jgi:hypothetical protein
MTQHIVLLMSAVLVGSMIFFAAVVAPTVFRVLPAEAAGKFLRALFPRYYLWGIIVSTLGSIAALWVGWLHFVLLALVLILFLYARQILMPKINASRDAELAGDIAAKSHFQRLHRLSVIINGVQIIAVMIVFTYTVI